MTATWKMSYLAALPLAWSDYHLEDAAQLNEKKVFPKWRKLFCRILVKTLHPFHEKSF
jgi:hypothetical protein